MEIKHRSENPPEVPLIVLLPNGRWRIDWNGYSSDAADYDQRILATFGREMFVGQTEYWGVEGVWEIKGVVTHNWMDCSVEE